jgi:DNA-binding MarR family transcriptional regulator
LAVSAASHRRRFGNAGPDDPVDLIETEVTRLSRTIALLGRSPESDVGLDRAGYLLLRTLERIGPASINTIASTVGLDGSTVTRQVSTMKELGLVEREINPGDRRSCIISPTGAGRELMRHMRMVRRSNLDTVTSDWTEDDRTALGRLLAKLNDSISRATGCADPIMAQPAS